MATYDMLTKAASEVSVLDEARAALDQMCRSLHDREAALHSQLAGAEFERDTIAKALGLVQEALKGLSPIDPTLPQVAPAEYPSRVG